MATYRPAAGTKPIKTGTAGVLLLYTVNGESVEVYELVDPNPGTAIAIDPATQAPADLQRIAGHDCLVWATPDRGALTQIAFKTSDGLLIYVRAQSTIRVDAAPSLVSQLSSPPS